MNENLARMIALAESTFDVRNDPSQLSINEGVIDKLKSIHPKTLNEETDANGPIAWILVIPTTEKIMREFLDGWINEGEILEKTLSETRFESVYLCSALVLPEFRNKGLARKLTLAAVNSIRATHPIKFLFYWPFSKGGEALAEAVAWESGLSLLRREKRT